MAGQRQRERIAVPEGWEKGFGLPSPRGKVYCLVCGSCGWPGDDHHPMPWQRSHILGHPEKCDRCGAPFIEGGLGKHRSICRGKPIGQYADLLRLQSKDGSVLHSDQ